MSKWTVKKGNTSIQEILIQDKDGVAVPNLATAEYIKFQVKESKTVAMVKIEKTKGDGIEVLAGEDLGKLQITLEPTDTNLTPKEYYMGLEIKWNDTVLYEVTMMADGEKTEVFEIEQDIVLPVAP